MLASPNPRTGSASGGRGPNRNQRNAGIASRFILLSHSISGFPSTQVPFIGLAYLTSALFFRVENAVVFDPPTCHSSWWAAGSPFPVPTQFSKLQAQAPVQSSLTISPTELTYQPPRSLNPHQYSNSQITSPTPSRLPPHQPCSTLPTRNGTPPHPLTATTY